LIGLVPDYLQKSNVIRAKSILNENLWNSLFPNALPIYTYENFLQAMAKYPKFCDETNGDISESNLENSCKIELATLLAHIIKSSDSLQKVEDDCATTLGDDCIYSDNNDQDRYERVEGQYYYGRGPVMMKTVKFYG